MHESMKLSFGRDFVDVFTNWRALKAWKVDEDSFQNLQFEMYASTMITS